MVTEIANTCICINEIQLCYLIAPMILYSVFYFPSGPKFYLPVSFQNIYMNK